MKHLYILRGVPGVGKSTLIKEFNLEPFTLSADLIRQQYGNTDYTVKYDDNGTPYATETINDKNESKVWELLLTMLESRMSRGETTIIDATHTNTKLMRTYNKLVDKYRYRVFTIQLNAPLETILENNANRREAKRVADDVVRRKYEDLTRTTEVLAKRYNLQQFDNIKDAGEYILTNSTWRAKEIKVDDYKKVYVIGDIHASYEVFKEFLDKYYSDDNYFVFVGDYLDRGLYPYETIKALHALHNKKNVVMLRGNHDDNYENWLAMPEKFTQHQIDTQNFSDKKVADRRAEHNHYKKLTRSSVKYIRELKREVTEEEFADFTDKLKQILHGLQDVFTFAVNGHTYVVTHGGIVANVLDYNDTGSMINFSSNNMVRGVGTYDDDVDFIFNSQMWELPEQERMTQIHGHRNTFENSVLKYPYSINVEQDISDGGYLGAVEIDVLTGERKDVSLKNENYRKTLKNTPLSEYPISKFYEDAKNDKYIKVKPLKTVENVYSVNFSNDAFYEKVWNSMTVQARGLFINPETEKVVARSYNKFFNLNERPYTKVKRLEEDLQFPVTVASKTNGFLGILTVYEDEFLFLSKSTDGSTFSQLFKTTFMKHVEELGIDLEKVHQFVKENDVSLVFEVIDTVNDPHIITYEKESGVVLLDVFKNQLEEDTLDKRSIPELDLFIKPEEFEVGNWKDLNKVIKGFNKGIDMRSNPVVSGLGEGFSQYNEGFIMTDASGFKVKVKGAFYSTWKGTRLIIHQRLAGKRGSARNNLEREFLEFISHEDNRETLTNSILTERAKFVDYINNKEG